MRIGFDVSALTRPHSPGIERVTRGLVDALERRGRLELVRLAPEPGAHLLAWRQIELPRAARRLALDGLHSPVSAFAWLGPGRRVQTIHELPWRQGSGENAGARHRFWVRIGARRADAIVVGTEFVARQLAAEVPRAADKLRVVPWAVSPAFHAAAEAAPEPAPERPFVLAVGAARPKKRAELVLPALDLLERERGLSIELVVTHVSERERAELAPRLDHPRVRLLGALAEPALVRLVRQASALVVLSESEGFGLPALEALACGTPVIVRAASAQAEVAGEAGIAVVPEDARALAAALGRALDERGPLRTLGLARAAHFSWDASAERVERLWRELGP